jgi:hypothetical protein
MYTTVGRKTYMSPIPTNQNIDIFFMSAFSSQLATISKPVVDICKPIFRPQKRFLKFACVSSPTHGFLRFTIKLKPCNL